MSDENKQLKGIPFEHLIGGPLKACIKAQEQASMSTWRYIKEVGLNGREDAVMVSFSFLNGGRVSRLSVPLLTIVPVPYFSIDTLDITFRAQLTETRQSLKESSGNQRAFYATYAMDTSSAQKMEYTSTLDIAVRATQDQMPSGLSKVLGFMEQSINAESAYLTLRDRGIAAALAGGAAKVIPNPLPLGFFDKKETKGIKLPIKGRTELRREDIEKIKALDIPYDIYPFFSIDDLDAFHSLLAFRSTQINLTQVQSFPMSRLADIHLLELRGIEEPLKPNQHIPAMDFSWLEQVRSLVLANFGEGMIPVVSLTSARELVRLEILGCDHEVVDISFCAQLKTLVVKGSRIKQLIVPNRFDRLQINFELDKASNVKIITRS